MKTVSSFSLTFLILLFQVACRSGTALASPTLLHKGLAVTSIDVIKTERKSEDGFKIVTFDGSIEGSVEDKTSTFLKDIKDIGGTLEAEQLTVQEAKEYLRSAHTAGGKDAKPLFCIHGFNTQPRKALKNMKKAQNEQFNEGKFMLIPVMWPTVAGLNYWNARGTSFGAANAFRIGLLDNLKKTLDSFPDKSLLVHSMGARVLSYAADARFKFDNIFMVAADVRHTLFRKEEIDKGNRNGLNIVNMLTKDYNGNRKGKVYVFFNRFDGALNISGGIANPVKDWYARLGRVGAHKKRNRFSVFVVDKSVTHPECVNHVENIDAGKILPWYQAYEHNYHFWEKFVDIYQSKHF